MRKLDMKLVEAEYTFDNNKFKFSDGGITINNLTSVGASVVYLFANAWLVLIG